MSFSTISAGRILKGQKNQKAGEETEFIFESFSNMGLSKTYNIDKQVPDSAGKFIILLSEINTKTSIPFLKERRRQFSQA